MKNSVARSGLPRVWHRWGKYRLIFVAITLIFLCLVAYQLTVSYQAARASAADHVQNLALVLESKLYADLDAAQRNVSDMAATLEPEAMLAANANRYEAKITPWLKSQVLDISSASVLQVFDAHGDLLYSNRGKEAPLNIADRAYFQQLKAQPASPVVFGGWDG